MNAITGRAVVSIVLLIPAAAVAQTRLDLSARYISCTRSEYKISDIRSMNTRSPAVTRPLQLRGETKTLTISKGLAMTLANPSIGNAVNMKVEVSPPEAYENDKQTLLTWIRQAGENPGSSYATREAPAGWAVHEVTTPFAAAEKFLGMSLVFSDADQAFTYLYFFNSPAYKEPADFKAFRDKFTPAAVACVSANATIFAAGTAAPEASPPAAATPPAAASPPSALLPAIERGDKAAAVDWLAKGASPDSADSQGRTALMYAGINGQRDIMVLLLDAGAKVNARSATGVTALTAATLFGDPEAVELLLAKGADVQAKEISGMNALAIAKMRLRTAPDKRPGRNARGLLPFAAKPDFEAIIQKLEAAGARN
ncbi:hypothetical protein BWI17_17760 [Betaproteobacteria bacterium GR16-43]|nr:hypothetical protein BWI17_17760 [Betaproteobacteria bacterium GR16-43]